MREQRTDTGAVPVTRRAALLGLLAVAAAGCGSQNGGATVGGGRTGAPSTVNLPVMVRGREANFHGEKSVVGQDSVTVELDDFYFDPTVLVGSPGQRLTVDLVNEGDMPHTFTVEDQGVDVVLQPGQRGQARIQFPQSGQQGFVCRFHIAQGMLGLLVTKEK